MSRIFLGVDGGKSSTNALIGDEAGHILGSGRGGPCNHVGETEGHERFIVAMRECLSQAAKEAGIPEQARFEASCLGFSAGPADKEPILREMLCTKHLIVTSDSITALSGATGGAPGIVTVAGTGSVSCGRNGDGVIARVGGWGYVFGDEGSAYDITRRALRAALQYEEGWGTRTVLHKVLQDATGIASMQDVVRQFYTTRFSRPQIASYAQLVNSAGQEGDRVACEILEYAAQQLALITQAVRKRLFRPDETVRVSYVGGVFRSSLVLGHFRALVETEGANRVEPPVFGPTTGALIEAYRSAGLNTQPTGLPSFDL